MQKKTFRFNNASVDYYFAGGFAMLKELSDNKNAVIITDENVFAAHEKRFRGWNTIVLKAGEAYKVQATIDSVIEQLIDLKADRKTTVVGVGGGVVTDITGYVASIYMRGVRFGFVPTTLLALVDASIGGKNGVDVGVYKNLVGTIRQPAFILHDLIFLNSLPEQEWRNGFAEVIKHACIRNASLFKDLEEKGFNYYRRRKTALCDLIQLNATMKTKVVIGDEYETGDRKLLNFGHTLGHALEKQYELSHGEAISIGMVYASAISEQLLKFKDKDRVVALLTGFGLPTDATFDKRKTIQVLQMDKKKSGDKVSFILLQRIGKATIQEISFDQLSQLI